MAIWSKVFSRINWQNKPSTTTPINATNLNSSDYALDTIDDRVLELNSRINNIEPAIADLDEAVQTAHEWAQWTDGTNPSLTDNAKAWSGKSQQYATNSADSAEDSEAWAIGERGGTPVGSSDETYRNNSKFYAGLAEDIIQGGVPDGTLVSFYISGGHMFVQQTIDGVQQPAQDLGVLVGSAVQTFESVAAMNTAIAGGTVADGTLCCVQQNIVMAETTNY